MSLEPCSTYGLHQRCAVMRSPERSICISAISPWGDILNCTKGDRCSACSGFCHRAQNVSRCQWVKTAISPPPYWSRKLSPSSHTLTSSPSLSRYTPAYCERVRVGVVPLSCEAANFRVASIDCCRLRVHDSRYSVL